MSVIQQLLAAGGPAKNKFDQTRILVPAMNGTYNITPYLYNWDTNSLTALTANSSFNIGNQIANILQTPNGDWYLFGDCGSSNPSSNFAICLSGTNTINYYNMNTGAFPDYNDYNSYPVWNPATSKVQYVAYPHIASSSTSSSVLVQITNTGSTNISLAVPFFGWMVPDMQMLFSQTDSGTITYGTTMLAQGASTKSAGADNYTWAASSNYTSFSQVANLASNGSRDSIAAISTTKAAICAFGGLYYYNGGVSGSITGVTYSDAKLVTQLSGNVFALWSKGDFKLQIIKDINAQWVVNLTADLSLSSTRLISQMCGVGNILWVYTVDSTGQMYLARFEINTSTGTYTVINRTLSGISNATNWSLTNTTGGAFKVYPQ